MQDIRSSERFSGASQFSVAALERLNLLALPRAARCCFPVILALLCLGVAGGQPAAPANLLPQGDFKNPGANTGWAEGFNIPGNQEFKVVSENGQAWLRIENHDAGRQLDYVHAYV